LPTTILALKFFLLLLPGFLSVKVSQRLTLYKEKSVFQQVIDALVFSLIIAAVYLGAAGLFPDKLVPLDRITIEEGDISFGGFDKFSLFALIIIAFIVGGVHGFVAEKGWVKQLLLDWHITRRSGRLNVWSDVFYTYVNSWLRVHMEDGVMIEGWCEYFSDSAQNFELFLQEVETFDLTDR